MIKNEVIEIKVEELNPYHEKIFHLYEGDRLDEMVASIKEVGVLTPIIVREYEGGWQILGGHNRVNASMIAGLLTVPAINYGKLSEDEARFIVTETNLMQRGFNDLSLLEQAACITVRYYAMKKQGFRVDLLEDIDELSEDEVGRSNAKLGKEFEMSPSTISRYVRIHEKLTDEMRDLVRAGKLGFSQALHLSFLTQEHQWLVASIIVELDVTVSKNEARDIKTLEQTDYLTEDSVHAVFVAKPNVGKTGVKLGTGFMAKYFPGVTDEDKVMEILEMLLDRWVAEKE